MAVLSSLKRFFIGKTLPTSAYTEERLSKAEALAVLSSDALSSVAYATQEALLVLVAAGTSSNVLGLSIPISLSIVLLLAIVVMSYRQTIRAYPKGGGSYIVARENLGLYPGLIAGGSLMIDYVLTVTVSVTAGVENLVAALPALHDFSVDLCLTFIVLLTLANLRGVRETGKLFMLPTYTFVFSMFVLIILGLFRQATGDIATDAASVSVATGATESLSLFLILRAFSAGCTALTGVEAISDGVLAFKPPEWKHARQTLIYLGVLLSLMFLGISYVAHLYHIVPDLSGKQTVISQLGNQIFGSDPLGRGMYYFVQISTLLVLLLAANTSFADFPRLCYFLARDGFLPRQLSILGDRLVYSNGILMLSVFAAILVIIFGGSTTALIPLYAVGVFTSFTLSQAGMVRHWFKERSSGWQPSALMNGIGTLCTALVLIVVIWTKFSRGAWLVILAIPLLVRFFIAVHQHYEDFAARISLKELPPRSHIERPKGWVVTHPALVVIGQLNRGTVETLDYARSIADEIVAVHVDIGSTDREEMQRRWLQVAPDIPLVILDSPYRSVVSPILDYAKQFEARYPGILSTIIIPAVVPRNWWESILHNQTTFFLKASLRAKRSRVVTTVRYYL